MSASFTVTGNPMGAPRMTRADAWRERPVVLRYRSWKDAARLIANRHHAPAVPGEVDLVAVFSMPDSWSQKKRAAMRGRPHAQKPDADNICKALMDALIASDQCVHTLSIRKIWDDGNGPRLEVEMR